MNNVTLTDSFPVIDITHKPKRHQGDNFTSKEPSSVSGVSNCKVPQNVTIESAIRFFEANADGEYKNLYNATATWLKTIISNKARNVGE